ncbi:ParB/RepB/Spo0J family partition protein [Pseudorhodoferax soli]|uniref:ParB family chromosome partitioning protein n=1 Tax=Pseudorhodoferax soli TaxID=545864 RepID=A0A368XJR3_9BURK|nr:ParB/RepB/Spo0J family partition protein [Pseudorhodoferax soli]RCW66274.1 ParB family chromosome partitioning protein [Pseudorhodoferax soli]
MSKKLAAKASLIQLPPSLPSTPAAGPDAARALSSSQADQVAAHAVAPKADAALPSPAAPTVARSEARAKTAPGTMAVFMATQSAAVREADDLRQKLKDFEGALVVRALDPRRIKPSRYANRHEDAFADKEFIELRNEISAAGTNVQPICVRPVSPDSGAGFDFEIVFGHRRHRACLDLGLLVQALIVELTDVKLFEAMERENRGRKNLSAWEQGMMYRQALDLGLYPSQRKMSEALGVDLALISKGVALARLPEAVVAAFGSPLNVQFRWAQPLSEALQRDPDGLVARAKEIAASNEPMLGKAVLDKLLMMEKPLNGSTPIVERRVGKAGRGALLRRSADGQVVLTFDPGVLTAKREAAMIAWLRDSFSDVEQE